MRRFLTLVSLVCLAIPAGISFSGCTRNPAANYCNGLGYGLKISDVSAIDLEPRTTGISLFFGKTQQLATPTATTCKGTTASVSSYTYGTTNHQLVDISPTGILCGGTWNRNTGGGIADYTVCSAPDPLPSTGGLPYGTAYVTASASSVSSNPVEVYVHPQVTSISLVGPAGCMSQAATPIVLDAQACYSGTAADGTTKSVLLCAPDSVRAGTIPNACAGGLPYGVALSAIPNCSASIGTLSFSVGTTAIASINSETNQITAEQPGTTAITATVAGSSSSAGYFSTCPPKSISVTLANGSTSGTVTQGTTQNLVTTVLDTNNQVITGLTLDYQSTNLQDITASSSGAITTSFPGSASIFAVCQPPNCNPAPIQVIGTNGTGLPIASNSVTVTTPGTSSAYLWFGAPGLSQYFVPVELINGTVGSTVRLPYVPNSMVMDPAGTDLYFGSARELMIYTASTSTLLKEDATVPGVVLAVSPDNSTLLINDQSRQVFYIYKTSSNAITATFGGLGNAATWTPDSKTLYITDNAALNNTSSNGSITGHTDTLYVYNSNTGWTHYPLPASTAPAVAAGSEPWSLMTPNTAVSSTVQTPAVTVPGVGAFFRGTTSTSSRAWCPSGTVGDYDSMTFYPPADLNSTTNTYTPAAVQSDVLAATTDGKHILGAALNSGSITLSDIGVTVPTAECSVSASGTGATLTPAYISHTTPGQTTLSNVTTATGVNQVVASPTSNLAFITYTGGATTSGASLPYYIPGTGPGYVTLNTSTTASTSAAPVAPIAGTFSPDNKTFYVSTTGDNLIHFIDVSTMKDTQQLEPKLPACNPVSDTGCILATPLPTVVPATVITVKPRATT